MNLMHDVRHPESGALNTADGMQGTDADATKSVKQSKSWWNRRKQFVGAEQQQAAYQSDRPPCILVRTYMHLTLYITVMHIICGSVVDVI